VFKNAHLTAVHAYRIENDQGDTRYLLINGGYCDSPGTPDVEREHPGWHVTGRTWRAYVSRPDWTPPRARTSAFSRAVCSACRTCGI
jgi:hypothetical protein